jgi:cytochrome c
MHKFRIAACLALLLWTGPGPALLSQPNSPQNAAPPPESRFQKVELAANLDEPMEMAVLPDGSVLVVERKGGIKRYDAQANQLRLVHTLPVFHDLEDGLLGLAPDPDFARNGFIYLFYSPVGEKPVQRVSRFRFDGQALQTASEKVLLEIPTQRKECCHSAGSLAFGPNGTLYIGVGDNTNPHNPGYYNSIDERPGREYWDAQRTAGNTHDLRGKVLRIKPEADGTYSIPEGNLFPKDGSKGRPEIYAMGCRNPYRIHVDAKTGYLYWGDVGQNTEDNPARGPISYDEFHQAKGPGFFGWPYFAGDNQPYADFDFETGKIGPFFDPARPVNASKNNTGSRELPPAQPAFIWYSYDESKRFKHLGTGGKSPIAGPVYRADRYARQPGWVATPRKFPDYYDGKLFIAEWMRDWINVVTMDEAGKLVAIERFMPSTVFDHPIELEFGPDGALYVLEYGTFWFAQNKNSRLVRIEYNAGNRPPVAMLDADKTAGAAPLTVQFSARKSYDHDPGDGLRYAWSFGGPGPAAAGGPTAQHTFARPGTYEVALTVSDPHGKSTTQRVNVQVGNEPPRIGLATTGNQSFYWPGKPLPYQVTVEDREDGSLAKGTIAPDDVLVTLDHLDMGTDLTFVAQQQQQAAQTYFHPGLELINKNDCRSCHHPEEASVGPSYRKVALRYQGDAQAGEALTQKIIKGGNGNWGETAMSAHPQLKPEEAAQMVTYILGLGKEDAAENRVPAKGRIAPPDTLAGSYLLRVTYRDKGGEGAPPQVGQRQFLLRPARLPAITCDDIHQAAKYRNAYVQFSAPGAYILFKNVDVTALREVTYAAAGAAPGRLELRLNKPDGPLLNALEVPPVAQQNQTADATAKDRFSRPVSGKLQPATGFHDVYVVYKNGPGAEVGMWNSFDLAWLEFK